MIEKPLPSLRDYELGKSIPGGEAIGGLVRAGINANWLLTGEGPMLLADWVAPAPPASTRINVKALEAIIEGALKVAPNAPAAAIAAHAARVYAQCIEDGLITPEGIGQGNLESAA